MRLFRRLVCVTVFAAALVACDSDQPLQVGEQTVTINVEGGNVQTPLLEILDMYLDNDGDNVPDDGQFHLFCRKIPLIPGSNILVNTTPRGAPVFFGLEVKIVREGTSVAEVISAPGSLAVDGNLSGYDSFVAEGLFATGLNPITLNNDTYKFCGATSPLPAGCRLPRRGSPFVRELVESPLNPLTQADSVTYGWGTGRCSSPGLPGFPGDPGPYTIDGQPGALDLQVQKGDTLIVTLKRGPIPPGLVNDMGTSLFIGQPLLSAIVTLNGRSVQPNGVTDTSTNEGSTVTFSLTTQ